MRKNKKIILTSAAAAILILSALWGARSKADMTSLTIARDPGAGTIGSRVFVPTGGLVDFNVFYITNNTAGPVSVDSIKVTRSGGADDYFTAIALFLKQPNGARTQIGTNQTLVAGTTYFSTLNLSILGNSSSTIYISAIIWGGAKNGDSIGLGISSAGDIYPSVAASVAGTVAPVMRTVDTGGADTTPPAAPSNIKVESIGSEPTLKISWSDPADTDLLKIVAYRSTASGQLGVLVYSTNRGVGIIPTTSFEDKNITVGTTYYYTVKAVDIANNESTNTTQVSGVVYPKGLNIFLDVSSSAAGNINASSSDVSLAAFKFVASNAEAVMSNLRITGTGDSRDISALKLFSDGALIEIKDNSANTAASASQTIDFSFLTGTTTIRVTANGSKIISLRADIPPSAFNGDKLTLSVKSLTARQDSDYPLSVYGLNTSGNTMTIIGGTTPSLSPSPSPSASPSPSPTPAPSVQIANLSEGAIIRAQGDIDVYIVKYVGTKKFKRLILSPSVFNNYGHLKWSDVREVERSTVDAFTTSELVRAVGDPKVYKLYPAGDTGQKRWVETAESFVRLGFDWDAIYEINNFDRDSYVTGENLE